MNKRDFVLLVLLVVAPVSRTLAQVPPPSSTTLRVQGTIDRYTPATRTLSLSTARGTVRFFIAPTIRIRQGWRKLETAELENLAGHHATVRYTQTGDRPVVESVHVFGR